MSYEVFASQDFELFVSNRKARPFVQKNVRVEVVKFRGVGRGRTMASQGKIVVQLKYDDITLDFNEINYIRYSDGLHVTGSASPEWEYLRNKYEETGNSVGEDQIIKIMKDLYVMGDKTNEFINFLLGSPDHTLRLRYHWKPAKLTGQFTPMGATSKRKSRRKASRMCCSRPTSGGGLLKNKKYSKTKIKRRKKSIKRSKKRTIKRRKKRTIKRRKNK